MYTNRTLEAWDLSLFPSTRASNKAITDLVSSASYLTLLLVLTPWALDAREDLVLGLPTNRYDYLSKPHGMDHQGTQSTQFVSELYWSLHFIYR